MNYFICRCDSCHKTVGKFKSPTEDIALWRDAEFRKATYHICQVASPYSGADIQIRKVPYMR